MMSQADPLFGRAAGLLVPDAFSAAVHAASWGSKAYRNDGPVRRFQRQVRAAAAAALRPHLSRAWFALVEGAALRPFANANPLLPLKPLRVYLSTNWTRSRRGKVILDTYAEAIRRGGALRTALLAPEGVLFVLSHAGEAFVSLRLHRDPRFRKEGEFTLTLECLERGGPVMSLAFSLERLRRGRLALYIGCVQGREHGNEAIHHLTKAMYGLRPKSFMMLAVQDLAAALGAHEIYGAGSSIQVHRRKHVVHLPRLHGLGFDYDAYWEEAGGARSAGGWFRLPLATPRRSRDEMRPNKRSMYAKRYAMLDQLRDDIRAAV